MTSLYLSSTGHGLGHETQTEGPKEWRVWIFPVSLKTLLRDVTLPKSGQAGGGIGESEGLAPLWDPPNMQAIIWNP